MQVTNNALSKEEMLAMWDEYPVKTFSICLPLPLVDYPPSFLQMSFGVATAEELAQENILSVFTAYEDQHPKYKGILTQWKILRCEIYPGTENCAYDAFVVCYCDRVTPE